MGRWSVTQITLGIIILLALVILAHTQGEGTIVTTLKRLHGAVHH